MADSKTPNEPQLSYFLVDDRPVVFVRDSGANRRFLQSIDPEFWNYQAEVHGAELDSDDADRRRRAATALRLAYGQGVETLFALLMSFIQVPPFMLGWLMTYRNSELRSAVRKVHEHAPIRSALAQQATWKLISLVINGSVPEEKRDIVSAGFARAWTRLAEEFLSKSCEPEYNSLKHGMRASVGGFSAAIGPEKPSGAPPSAPSEMQSIGANEYGSMIWMPPEKLDDCKHSYQLTRWTSRAWTPRQFVLVLHLLRMSVRNIVSTALIRDGVDPATVRFEWPREPDFFDEPWKERPALAEMSFGSQWKLSSWVEPSAETVRSVYD